MRRKDGYTGGRIEFEIISFETNCTILTKKKKFQFEQFEIKLMLRLRKWTYG